MELCCLSPHNLPSLIVHPSLGGMRKREYPLVERNSFWAVQGPSRMENSKGRTSGTGSNADIASTISDFEEVRLEDMEHSGSGEEVTWSGTLLAVVSGRILGYPWCGI